MGGLALLGFVLAMSITMVLMPLLMRWALSLGFLDMPEARKVHSVPVPRVGGIAMIVGFLTALMSCCPSAQARQALAFGSLILLCFGIWDDRKALAAAPKFAGQALAAVAAMLWGGISIATITLSDRMPLPRWVALPLTLLFLIGGTNAFNLADGLDGLAGGMGMLCLCGTALLAFTLGSGFVGSAAVVMIGALLGFLRFNTHPARVFMGDGGSQVLGFVSTALAILLTQDPRFPLSTALPLLLLGVPIVDTLMVMTERLMAGRSPFVADQRHLHHRLLAVGFQHWQAVGILYLAQTVLFVAAWFLRYAPDLDVLSVFLLFATLLVVPLRLALQLKLQIRRAKIPDASVRASGRDYTHPHAIAASLLVLTLGSYAAWILLYGAPPPLDIRLLAAMLGATLIASLVLKRSSREFGWSDRLALYPTAPLAIFLSRQAFPDQSHPPLVECVLFPLLALATLVFIRTTQGRAFRLTPLDFLVLLIVVTVPNLPDSVASARSLGLAVAELVLLFYALEALTVAVGRRWRWLSGSAALFLLGLSVRAIL